MIRERLKASPRYKERVDIRREEQQFSRPLYTVRQLEQKPKLYVVK